MGMVVEQNSYTQNPPVAFALEKLKQVVPEPVTFRLALALDSEVAEQGYRMTVDDGGVAIYGGGDAGLMYGILDLRKQIVHRGGIEGLHPVTVAPYLKNRGIKLNIPLDSRTPSYSDASDSAVENIVNMWDKNFWMEFLDRMALEKYNLLSLWTLSPFPSLVKIPEYPLASLDDVKRRTRPVKHKLQGQNMYAADVEQGLITVKKMTIDDKISFWQWVMEYAASRCIQVMLFTWNVFTYGVEHTPYGITPSQENPVTEHYIYCGVKALMRTYPLLAGIGITAGENMYQDDTDIPFIGRSYGRAVREIMEEQPGRDFRLIQRMQNTRYDSIMKTFEDFPCAFEISFKYSQAHMYTTTKPTFIQSFLEEKKPSVKIWLTIRNDDFYMFRWGEPDFARAYLKQMPIDTMQGFYMGADGFTWGRDYMDTQDKSHPLFIAKMWYMFGIWGQLSYCPDLPKSYFEAELRTRLGASQERLLYETWQHASSIIPETNCTHFHDFDYQWYPEGCCMYEEETGKLVFADINEFVSCQSVPGGDYASVSGYCQAVAEGRKLNQVTPLEQAASIWEHAEQALAGVDKLRGSQPFSKEMQAVLDDIQTLAHLGHYYSLKLQAAVQLCLYRMGQGACYQTEAASLLRRAEGYWKLYSDETVRRYRPQVLTRMCGLVDVTRFQENARLDVLLAMEG